MSASKDRSEVNAMIGKALRHQAANDGRHLHHRDCIHNMPPEQQVGIRGRTVEWWMRVHGKMPERITPDHWECESPLRDAEAKR